MFAVKNGSKVTLYKDAESLCSVVISKEAPMQFHFKTPKMIDGILVEKFCFNFKEATVYDANTQRYKIIDCLRFHD
jgi:hypothetical protein